MRRGERRQHVVQNRAHLGCGSGPRINSSARVRPDNRSITMNGVPACSPLSCTATMCGMRQAGGGPCLDFEAPAVVGLNAECRMQQLDRDGPVQPGIPAVANFGHPSAAQNPPQFVAAAKNFWRLHAVNASATVNAPATVGMPKRGGDRTLADGYDRGDALPATSPPFWQRHPLMTGAAAVSTVVAALERSAGCSLPSSGSPGWASPSGGGCGPTRYATPGCAPAPSTSTG